MKFENILADINGFGRFQKMMLAINFIGRFTLPCHFMLNNFIAAVPSHHCDISSLDEDFFLRNLSQAERLSVSIPLQEDGSLSSCQMFAEPQYDLLLNSSSTTDAATVPCQNGWVYDTTTFKSTLTSQVTFISFMYSFKTYPKKKIKTYFLGRNNSRQQVSSFVCVKWDLVCDSRGKNKATASIFFIGVMFGALTFGSLSDRYLQFGSFDFQVFQRIS